MPTPRGGGLVIVLVSLVGFMVLALPLRLVPIRALACYLAAATAIAAVSWWDDLHSLPALSRLAVHTGAALALLVGIGFVQQVTLPVLGSLRMGLWGLPLSLVWTLGLTNVYNFMDGIDGLAGSQAVIAGLGWAALGMLSGQLALSVMGGVIAAGSLGFLLHNWPPARVFMGDVGSAFLGFTFAALTIAGAQTDQRLALAGILLVWPFVFDAGLTILRRLLRRENVLAPHRTHLYQRLVIAGRSHLFVTCLYTAMGALGVLAAVLWFSRPTIGTWLTASIIVAAAMLWIYTQRTEKRAKHRRDSQMVYEA